MVDDFASDGSVRFVAGKILKQWKYLRTFERATTEDYEHLLIDVEHGSQNLMEVEQLLPDGSEGGAGDGDGDRDRDVAMDNAEGWWQTVQLLESHTMD